MYPDRSNNSTNSKNRERRRQNNPTEDWGHTVTPDILGQRSKHLSIVKVEDYEDLVLPPKSVLPLPVIEEFCSSMGQYRRNGGIGGGPPPFTTTTCDVVIMRSTHTNNRDFISL